MEGCDPCSVLGTKKGEAFDLVLKEAMLQRLREISISETLITTIIHLYEAILGCLCTMQGLSYLIRIPIGVT